MTIAPVSALSLLFCLHVVINDAAVTTTPPNTHHHHHTRPTKEPAESGVMSFQYDHYCHLIAFKDDSQTCYIYSVSYDERQLVHTDTGFFQLETQIVTIAANATETYARDDLSVRSSLLSNFCPDGFSLIKLN